jgi:sigma-B regulation protein RsbU (phosphoserine phosphatase)
MRDRLGIDQIEYGKTRVEDLLTVGSKIFFQTHLLPLIKMQAYAHEIFLTFKSKEEGDVPVLLNVKSQLEESSQEFHCGGMIISNRNRFEKELLLAKKAAEEAITKNEDLLKMRAELEIKQHELEMQLQKLSALNRQQKDIFKVITHDLQEPLRKAVMFANIIVSQNADLPQNVLDKLGRIVSSNEQMRQMMLSLQRMEELNNREVVSQQVSLLEIIEDAIKSSEIDRDKLVLQYELECSTFCGDQKLLTNMFAELFINSARFNNPRNEFYSIQISSMVVQRNIFIESVEKYRYEDFVKLTFADDGIGFSTDISKVFKIFQRGEQFDTISPGLAYCRKIVELHNGTILAKSVRGKGAGFTIFIPLKQQR